MTHRFVVAAGCAALLSCLVGCSSPEPVAATKPASGRVTFGSTDAGPVTAIGCVTENGYTTISIEGSLHTTVVVTEGEAPTVKSVSIGAAGTDQPALAYVDGAFVAPVVASRDGNGYTVTGNGLGTDLTNLAIPVHMPFDIAVTCP